MRVRLQLGSVRLSVNTTWPLVLAAAGRVVSDDVEEEAEAGMANSVADVPIGVRTPLDVAKTPAAEGIPEGVEGAS
jgi:hypothetical protein